MLYFDEVFIFKCRAIYCGEIRTIFLRWPLLSTNSRRSRGQFEGALVIMITCNVNATVVLMETKPKKVVVGYQLHDADLIYNEMTSPPVYCACGYCNFSSLKISHRSVGLCSKWQPICRVISASCSLCFLL